MICVDEAAKMKSVCSVNMAIKALILTTLAAHLFSLLENTHTLRIPDVVLDHPNAMNLHAKEVVGGAWNFKPSTNYESVGFPPPPAVVTNNRPLNASDLKNMYPTISLVELVNTDPNPECDGPGPTDRALVESTIIEDVTITHPKNRKIPKIIHVTSKTRCMPLGVRQNLDLWRFTNYSFYVHDDAAVDRLLWETYFPEFPHLSLIRPCMISGAAKADLWRYLVLYQYGGLYTDIDSAPGRLFANGTAIGDDDDAWFVIERAGTLSQYFMSSSPKHPLMYLAVITTLRRLLEVERVGFQYVPFVTGPGALKEAYSHFTHKYGNGDKEDVAVDFSEVDEGHESEGNDAARRRLTELEAATQMNATSNVKWKEESLQAGIEAVSNTSIQEVASSNVTDVPPRTGGGGIEEGVYVGMLGRTVTIGASKKVSSKGRDITLYECTLQLIWMTSCADSMMRMGQTYPSFDHM